MWMGDFNYRIDCDYETVVDRVKRYAAGDKSQINFLLDRVREFVV
jgi:hypothetical protein